MAKGFISLLGNKSSNDPSSTSDDQPAPPSSSRMSTSSRFPSLRRLETKDKESPASSSRPTSMQSRMTSTTSNSNDFPAWLQPPASSNHPANSLIHLKFSGPSFLDVVAKDAHSKEPLYVIETVNDVTILYRLDHRTKQAVRAAGIQWPHTLSKGKTTGRTVQMGNSRWRDAEEFLKFGTLANFANRRFNIPHWPHPLKWKLVPGNSYYCTTQDIKGPIAVLDAAVLSAPPRLRIYNNMTKDGDRPQQNIKGVPILLLDYLITTSLLLVTEVQEWLDRPQTVDGRVRIPGSSAPAVQKWLAIIHGEPAPTSPASPTLTAVSSQWDERSYRHSGGAASIADSSYSDPVTPSTPATSTGSYFAPRDEDIPPVPPLPETVRLSLTRRSEVPSSNYPSSDCLPTEAQLDNRPSTSSSSTRVPSALSSKAQSLRGLRGSRPLPTPPSAPSSSLSAPRPWPSAELRTPSPSTPGFDRPASSASSSSSTSNSRRSLGARSSVGRTLAVTNMPLHPPPGAALPLPPKLAQEFNGRPGVSPYGNGESSAVASMSVLQMSNPDPLPPDEEERIRQATASMQAMNLSPPARSPPPLPSSPPPPLAYAPNIAYHQDLDPNEHMRDAGMVSMTDAARRQSYAETIYEMPPPAYDAIDFTLPQLHAPRR